MLPYTFIFFYTLHIPNVNTLHNIITNILYGTNVVIKAAITINGPNGMYSSVFFFFVARRNMLIIAPSKNAIKDIIIIPLRPKYKPNAPISLTSPKPIASFPAINPPSNVITKNIPAPITMP